MRKGESEVVYLLSRRENVWIVFIVDRGMCEGQIYRGSGGFAEAIEGGIYSRIFSYRQIGRVCI